MKTGPAFFDRIMRSVKAYHALLSSSGGDVDDLVLSDVALSRVPADPQWVDGGVGHLEILHSAQSLWNRRDTSQPDTMRAGGVHLIRTD